MEKDFYKAEEVGAFFGVSKWTVYRFIKQGKLKAIKVGRQYRVAVEDLKKFLKELKKPVQE